MSTTERKVMTMAEPSRTYNYKGYEMRSIAEARWAAFFDICGIKWQYEPISTGDYIPDFLLFGENAVLVEVKGGATTIADLSAQTEYVSEKLGGYWTGDVVLLGASPFIGSLGGFNDVDAAGLILERYESWQEIDGTHYEESWEGSEAVIGICESLYKYPHDHPKIAYGFRSFYGSYNLRPYGCYDGNCYRPDADDIAAKWAEATNRVRYLHGGAR